MMALFKPPRCEPAAHRDVFAEFAMRLLGLLVERHQDGREPEPRQRVAR